MAGLADENCLRCSRSRSEPLKNADITSHAETEAEELASAVTHAIGLLLSAGVLAWMVTRSSEHGDLRHVATLSVFGASLVMVYLASTLYHSAPFRRVKRFLKLCDHAAIYILIAGTYTPFMLVTIGGGWGWSMFGVMWGLAALGVCLRIIALDWPEPWSAALYLAMGWMCLICAQQVIEAMSISGLAWLAAGGLAYTLGVVFFLWDRLPFNHAIWHLFVMTGSACHIVAACHDVLPTA